MRILLIGPLPPPLGGVSVYLSRHKRLLERDGHDVFVLDPTRMSRVAYYTRLLLVPLGRYDLIADHVEQIYVMLMLLVTGMASRTEVVDSNWRQLERWAGWKIRLYGAFLRRCKGLVLCGAHLESYYREHGVTLPEGEVRGLDPFIPPPLEDEEAILATYPAEVLDFAASRRPLIAANAFQIIFYHGVDLYGLDMCVEMVASLKESYPNVGLIFALAEVGDATYLEKIKLRIDELGIKDNFFFLTGQRELWPLFRRADLMVRPTCSDGYGISVAEALHLGCQAVASDVCKRTPGTLTFANRDAEDFLLKCRLGLDKAAARVAGGA
ncbi:MAG TPA: glycosyltransferase [Pyrinomonadaceae bacterium]|jgi:glycosyltransferase involved in cell wall biosynthesis